MAMDPQLDVVTGGAGFIGSHLVEHLLAQGRKVRVVDNLACGDDRNLKHLSELPGFSFCHQDIRDRSGTIKAIAGASRVFHLAALADIVPSIQQPEAYYDTNATGSFNVLQAARAAGVKRFVYAASSSCYGIPDHYPTPESAEIRPQYPYALTKYLGEQLVMHWGQVYDLPVVSLRFFNVYGPRARTSGVYGAVFGVFLAQIRAGKPLTIVGDGEQTRDFTYVGDIADALIAAADARNISNRIYNVGTGRDVSVNRLVELLGVSETLQLPKRPGEPDCTLADVSRITEEIGWQARTSIEQGVKIMLGHIDYWQNAPVWTPESISAATEDWFRYLSKGAAA